MRVTSFLFAVAIALGGPSGALADVNNDYEDVRGVVDEFITGWRDGNAELLASAANLEHGHAIWLANNDGTSSVTSVTFGQMIEGLTPHPDYGVPYRILSVNIAGDALGFVNVAAQQGDSGTILDYFTLMKVEDRWEVIALEWLWRPGMLVDKGQGGRS